MKKYRHMMEQVALSDRKKEEIMEQLETKETQKRRMPKASMIILAAALAVGCLLSIAAAANLPARVYNFVTGGQISVIPGGNSSAAMVAGDLIAPVRAEDGRLWFEADGQRVDITDKINEETPYIYERTDPGTGEKGYVIAGGTAENLGWAELFVMDGQIKSVAGQYLNGFDIPELSDEGEVNITVTDQDGNDVEVSGFIFTGVGYRPWYLTALDQLGLEY